VELEGDLSAFSLRELIEMIVYSSVTGALELHIGASQAQIFFRDGLPYHAYFDEVEGVDALTAMFEARSGSFFFRAGPVSAGESLWGDPWELIDRAEAMAKSWARVRPVIPSLDLIPILSHPPDGAAIQISEQSWSVLSAIDGRRAIPALAAATGRSMLDICEGLAPLVARRLVTLASPESLPSAGDQAEAADGKQEAGGFFERLITRALEEEAEQRRQSDPNRATDPSNPRQSTSDPNAVSDPNLSARKRF
jgi:hypothetical protein